MTKPDLSIIIPAYNEGPQFGGRMGKLADFLSKHDYGQVEVAIMMQSDDKSGDVEEAQQFVKSHPSFRIINLGQRAGKGGAVKAGMLQAKGRYRLFMDADLATPLHHFDDVKVLMERGADVGIATRNLVQAHDSFVRKFITQFGNILAQVILLPGIKDTQCGFKVFSAEAAEAVFSRQTINGWGFDLEILAVARKLGYRVETFGADDWKDPKTAGLVGDSPVKAAIQVFRDLLNVRFGLMIGRYNKPQSAAGDKRLGEHLADMIDKVVLGGSLLVGTILRFCNISKASIWHDEGYTMMLAPQSPGQIIMRTARDVHPPLYYLSLHYWLELFGHSELAARSFSAVLTLGLVVIGFLLARELFGHKVARVSAILLAIGPFLVRYGQEARMYGMVALLVILSTYWLVKATQTNRNSYWLGYSLAVAAALYTHYYAVFAIALFWLYVLMIRKPRPAITNPKWWVSNVASVLIFVPWLPKAYEQFTRVQGGFWIPKPTLLTLPSTLAQFLTFTDLGVIASGLRILATLIFIALTAKLLSQKETKPQITLVAGLAFLAPLAVLVLSLKRPIYVDRYFVFAAAGFYILVAVMLYRLAPWRNHLVLRYLTIILLVITCSVGVRNVYAQATHNMRQIGEYVNANYGQGDGLVSGELYTYFDFDYYNQTGKPAQLLAPSGVSGFGETSLLYDRANEIVIHSFDEVQPQTGFVWVVGKPGHEEDFAVPDTWQLQDEYQTNSSLVRHYHINGY